MTLQTIDPRHTDQAARLQQRMNEMLQSQALRSIQAEDQARAQAEAQAFEKARVYLAQVMQQASEQLAALGPVYAERARAATELLEPLARFWAAEQQIRAQLGQVNADLFAPLARAGLSHAATVADLRRRAGIPEDHAIIGLAVDPADEAQRLAATVVKAIALGLVQPGGVSIGHESIALNVNQGV